MSSLHRFMQLDICVNSCVKNKQWRSRRPWDIWVRRMRQPEGKHQAPSTPAELHTVEVTPPNSSCSVSCLIGRVWSPLCRDVCGAGRGERKALWGLSGGSASSQTLLPVCQWSGQTQSAGRSPPAGALSGQWRGISEGWPCRRTAGGSISYVIDPPSEPRTFTRNSHLSDKKRQSFD